MSVLAALALLSLFPGFAIAQISAPNCTSVEDWTWSFNTLGQNPCTIAAYLDSTCNQGSYTIDPLIPGHSYRGPTKADIELCPGQCTTVMYSLMSACGACQGEDWLTLFAYSYNCSGEKQVTGLYNNSNDFPNSVPPRTRVPYWASIEILAGSWSIADSQYAGRLPETYPDEFAGEPTITSLSPLPSTSYLPLSTSYPPPSTPYPSSPGGEKTTGNRRAIAGGVIAGVACIAIAVTIFFHYLRRQNRVRGPPECSTVNDDSQALNCKSAVSGESQAQSVGSPVNGESSMSYSGSGSMGGMEASPIVSGFNTISQELLVSPPSASAVYGASQPHMEEERQSVPNYVTILQPLRARPSPTQMMIYTPNFTTPYPESSRGAPSVPSVPSQVPTSLYTASVSASTSRQTWDQGGYHGPPIA